MEPRIQLWVDDERPMPEGYSHVAKTAQGAIALLSTGYVTLCSLDHDLGPASTGTGYDVAKWMSYTRGKTQDTRLASLWFGQGVKDNHTALEAALAMAV